MLNDMPTITLICPACGHNEAFVTTYSQHNTARCTRCQKYIKHISDKEFKEKAYPKETETRKQIKALVDQWCENQKVEGYVGWKRLYRLFERHHGIDLVVWGQGEKKRKHKSGLDIAFELDLLDPLYDVAIKYFGNVPENPPPDDDGKEIEYPAELIEKIESQIPPDILQVIRTKGVDVIGIYRLIKNTIISFQAAQFYARQEEKKCSR